jgi:hypothetical protein
MAAAASAVMLLTGCGGGREPEARGQLFCVAPTGSDRNVGSCTAPWKTIQKAFNTLKPGQTALVHGGVYRKNVIALRSGRPTAHIVVRAYAGEIPVIRGQLKISANNIRVVGFSVDGRGLRKPGPLVYVTDARSVTLERLDVSGSKRSGIFVGGLVRDVTVIGCWVHDNGTRARLDHGIALGRGTGGQIDSNVIEHNRSGGIQIYPGFDDVLVNQNTIVRNGSFGVLVGGEVQTSDRVVIVNNIVAFNGTQGIRTFWGGKMGTNNLATNNLIWQNGQDDVSRSGIAQRENFHAAPRFVSSADHNYRLQRRSPAVGQGLIRYLAPIDRDGRPRPQGQRPDLGAFER